MVLEAAHHRSCQALSPFAVSREPVRGRFRPLPVSSRSCPGNAEVQAPPGCGTRETGLTFD